MISRGPKTLLLAAMLAGAVLAPARAPAAGSCLDVALVLAVDSSGSISSGEYVLQRNAIAAAFRAPQVLDAVARAGQVAVSIVFWGSEDQPKPQTPWFTISGRDGAEQFARTVESMPRLVTGETGLGAGLLTALAKFDTLQGCSIRKIVNLSGDGAETTAVRGRHRLTQPSLVRDLAQSRNVEINALAISTDEPNLREYYAANVITGPNRFVMEVRSYADFAMALQRKLVREISPQAVSALSPPAPGGSRLD